MAALQRCVTDLTVSSQLGGGEGVVAVDAEWKPHEVFVFDGNEGGARRAGKTKKKKSDTDNNVGGLVGRDPRDPDDDDDDGDQTGHHPPVALLQIAQARCVWLVDTLVLAALDGGESALQQLWELLRTGLVVVGFGLSGDVTRLVQTFP